MKFLRWHMRMRWLPGAAGVVSLLILAGCDRDQDRVYHVPKDDAAAPDLPASVTPAPDLAPPPPAAPAVPQLGYRAPEGWQEKTPGQMRVASFTAVGPDGQSADIGVIPLSIVGRDLELINMWRSQVQLPPTSDPAVVNAFEPVTIGDGQGRLFEFVSASAAPGKSRQRVLVARLTRGGLSWFFRMAGDDAFVAAQKGNFLRFLKSVSFPDAAPGPMEAASSEPSGNADASWTAPPDWQPVPPAQFLIAEYSIQGANGAKADVNVAVLDGDGGGPLANINRWRVQIGLGPIDENGLAQISRSVDGTDGKETVVHLVSKDARTSIVGVIVPENGRTWFYKMTGDTQLLFTEEDAFFNFIQSAHYANAR